MNKGLRNFLCLILPVLIQFGLHGQICYIQKFEGTEYFQLCDTAQTGLVTVYVIRKDNKLAQIQYYRNGIRDSVWSGHLKIITNKIIPAKKAITLNEIKKNIPPAFELITYHNGLATEFQTQKNNKPLLHYLFAPNGDVIEEEKYNEFGNKLYVIRWKDQNQQNFPLTTIYLYNKDSKKQTIEYIYSSYHLYKEFVPIYENGDVHYIKYGVDYRKMKYEGNYIIIGPDHTKKEITISQGRIIERNNPEN